LAHFGGFLETENCPQKTLQPYELQGFESGTPERIRTAGLLIRSQALYPAELRVLCAMRGAARSRYFKAVSRISAGFWQEIFRMPDFAWWRRVEHCHVEQDPW
jgi:hypothetical protein